MEKSKKPTKGDLERRMRNALVLVPKTSDTQSVYFDDRGLRLEVTEDYALIKTLFHTHVFSAITSSGYSRPYLYTKRFVEMALENDCTVKDAKGNITRSFQKLLDVLKNKKEDEQNEYNIATYYSWWLFNIFQPLYSIGENAAESFMVYFRYISNIAVNSICLDEHADGLTNTEFVSKHEELIREFTKGMSEQQIFAPKTDEQLVKEEMNALREQENQTTMEGQGDGGEG